MNTMGPLKVASRLLVFLFVLTLIGQLRWNGRSFENYYHNAVNSETFQDGWATLTAPFRWFGDRVGLTRESSKPEMVR